MQVLILVSVRDIKAEAFMPAMSVAHTQLAVRSFMQEVQREAPDNMINKYPEDFELWQVGEFNTATGELTYVPQRVLRGVDAVRSVQ